jgi:hypothetical protein
VVRLNVTVLAVQLLVQDVEAEETHFGNGDSWLGYEAIAVGVTVLMLTRRMTILERKELSTCHFASLFEERPN